MERRRAHFGTSEPSDEKDLKFLYGRENILKNFFEADVRRFVAGKDGLRQLASRVDQSTFVVQGRLVQVREGVKVPTFCGAHQMYNAVGNFQIVFSNLYGALQTT